MAWKTLKTTTSGNKVTSTQIQTNALKWITRGKVFRSISTWTPFYGDYKSTTESEVIGLVDPTLVPSTVYGMDIVTFDYLSNSDKSILQLYNSSGSSIVVYDISIRGKPVYKISGKSGYTWEYEDYDSIDKEGEKSQEISNDFICSSAQAESVGDYVWKILKAHDIYQLSLVGCQYNFVVGGFYNLVVSYSLPTSTSEIESIDIQCEVLQSSFERSVGGVGSTVLTVRKKIGTWNKSTSRKCKLLASAKSTKLYNRSTEWTVAPYDNPGQADVYCDGTADEEEIQALINSVYANGGGTIHLLAGTFNISSQLEITDKIILYGDGNSTILNCSGNGMTIDDATEIYGIHIIGPTTGTNWGIYAGFVYDFSIHDCKIENFRYGIYCNYTIGGNISKNYITGFWQIGIRAENTIVDANTIKSSHTFSSYYSVSFIISVSDCTITNNIIKSCSNIYTGNLNLDFRYIYIVNGKTVNVSNNIISGNTITSTSSLGIWQPAGIIMLKTSYGASITGNNIEGNSISYTYSASTQYYSSIDISSDSNGISVTGNTIQSNTSSNTTSGYNSISIGVDIDSGCSDCTISSNIIKDNTSDGSSYGIYIVSGATANVVVANRVSGHTTEIKNNGTSTTVSGNNTN